MIKIEVDDRGVSQALAKLIASGADLTPALQSIGEILVDSTRQRFATSTAPDGSRWAANSQTTILRYLGRYKSSYSKKTGKISQKGAERAIGKRPLIGESVSLSRQIAYSIEGGDTLYIGSTVKDYAAIQQFGAKKHQFGAAPWGDIPARPFLGLSDSDRSLVLDVITDYLKPSGRS